MRVPVLLPNIFDHPFTYLSDQELSLGDYVEVPFGKKKLIGVVWNEFEKESKKKYKLKKIIRKINRKSFKKETVKFINWFSEYNIVPKGMVLKLHFSNNSLDKKNKENFENDIESKIKRKTFELNIEQKKSYLELIQNDKYFRVHVLQGTTGSGKTIVYFKSIEKKIKEGFQCLILLPEIGLTKEFEKKFNEYFGYKPIIWHSGITKKNKKIAWEMVSEGLAKVVIGARSSLFLPFQNLGLITIDEEHDQSYKQDEGVIYNARDMAISKASFENIPVNLISAVPSLETFNNVKNKKYAISKIIKRYRDAKLPEYEIVDIKKEIKKSIISSKIFKKVEMHLEKKDQVLFFINRRGYSPFVLCKNCLKIYDCPSCSINLVYHKIKKIVLCHYCGFKANLKRDCSNNNKQCEFIFSGPGVEKVFDEVKKLFPTKNILIFSSDTMNKKNSDENLKKIIDNKAQILIGTQLISKGYHFPNLNCIIILDLDFASRGYDLRSAEKIVQLYHQLSGRAGREGKKSKVYFQTVKSQQNIISEITSPDPYLFLERELNLRKKYNLPPFERFISIIISSKNENECQTNAYRLVDYLKKKIKFTILGPVNAPIYKLRGSFRNRILIRSKKTIQVQKDLKKALNLFKKPKEIKLQVDVDPINFN
mgnify:CR=1 FL=1|tara:strand:- start:1351 stop:3303 length:1953 start_codon:yes stop_codon:yes gene_type:complete